jgi:hypothetical protein
MVESMFSGQSSRVKIRSLDKDLFGLLVFLWKGFWPKELFGKHTFRLILTAFFFRKIGFAKHTSKKFQKKKLNQSKIIYGSFTFFFQHFHLISWLYTYTIRYGPDIKISAFHKKNWCAYGQVSTKKPYLKKMVIFSIYTHTHTHKYLCMYF